MLDRLRDAFSARLDSRENSYSASREDDLGSKILDFGSAQKAGSGQQKKTQSAWESAVQQHMKLLPNHHVQSPIATSFQSFGMAHLAVAELLWEQRASIFQQERLVHISNASGLIAVCDPRKRIVQLRPHVTAMGQLLDGSQLQLRTMPSAASLLDTQAAQSFTAVSVPDLLWHYGQRAAHAVHSLGDLAQKSLRVRRFPPVEPAALLMRHLALIHILCQNAMPFSRLQHECDDEDAPYLCADLASLHLTGALAIIE
jgi:hypothetical protein